MRRRNIHRQSIDLFDWPKVAAARDELERAALRRNERARALHLAPHGEIATRRRRFEEATEEVLRAHVELTRVLDETVH